MDSIIRVLLVRAHRLTLAGLRSRWWCDSSITTYNYTQLISEVICLSQFSMWMSFTSALLQNAKHLLVTQHVDGLFPSLCDGGLIRCYDGYEVLKYCLLHLQLLKTCLEQEMSWWVIRFSWLPSCIKVRSEEMFVPSWSPTKKNPAEKTFLESFIFLSLSREPYYYHQSSVPYPSSFSPTLLRRRKWTVAPATQMPLPMPGFAIRNY